MWLFVYCLALWKLLCGGCCSVIVIVVAGTSCCVATLPSMWTVVRTAGGTTASPARIARYDTSD